VEGVWGKLFKVRYHRRLLVFPTILLAQGELADIRRSGREVTQSYTKKTTEQWPYSKPSSKSQHKVL